MNGLSVEPGERRARLAIHLPQDGAIMKIGRTGQGADFHVRPVHKQGGGIADAVVPPLLREAADGGFDSLLGARIDGRADDAGAFSIRPGMLSRVEPVGNMLETCGAPKGRAAGP